MGRKMMLQNYVNVADVGTKGPKCGDGGNENKSPDDPGLIRGPVPWGVTCRETTVLAQ